MLKILISISTVVFLINSSLLVCSQDAFQVESIDMPPQADTLAADLTQLFSDKGYRIKNAAGRIVSEIWLCKQWEVEADFQATEQRLYPFKSGQLIGLLHLSRKGSEFRQHEVPSGWYTLRFGLQPVDGNHEGTSIIRDFLLMISADRDEASKDWDEKELSDVSAESIGATHPSMLSLQRADGATEVSIRHDTDKDWWILRGLGNQISGTKSQVTPLDIVVVGHAAE
jgi:hypothetical protein